MLHCRNWCLHIVDSVEELATKLTEQTWTLCTAFAVNGFEQYVFVNDSTGEDNAQEYAVVLLAKDQTIQIESLTVSWSNETKVTQYIRHALSGAWDHNPWATPVTLTLQTPHEHGRCPLCM